MNKVVRGMIPLAGLFFTFTFFVLIFSRQIKEAGFDINVLIIANTLLFLLSIISFFKQHRGMTNPNPHVFVRGVISVMMLKMIICLAAIFIYVYYSANYNKRSVFVALFLYLGYLTAEVYVIMKMNKKKNA